MRIKQLFELVKLNLLVFFREPGAMFWSFAFPVGMAWVLGIAFSSEAEKKYTVYVVGEDISAALYNTKIRNGEMTIGKGTGVSGSVTFKQVSKEEVDLALKKGVCQLYIDKKEGQTYFHYDPSNSEAVTLFMLLEREIAANKKLEKYSLEKITTKGNRYIDFLLPGLFAMGIMNSCVWGISWYLLELRMKKLLRRIVATPLKKTTFILSHFISRFLLTAFESAVLLLFAWLFFDTQITGSFMALLVLYVSGVLVFGGIGLLIGSRTQSTHIGNGLINAVVLPMTILSGIFFSYDSFPKWAIPVIKLLPLTVLTDSLRSVFNQGYGLTDVLFPSALLSFTGILCYFIGIRLFKWY